MAFFFFFFKERNGRALGKKWVEHQIGRASEAFFFFSYSPWNFNVQFKWSCLDGLNLAPYFPLRTLDGTCYRGEIVEFKPANLRVSKKSL